MTNDKELVEVWRKQFEEWTHDFPGDQLSKVYLEFAWMEAKRTQPIVDMSLGQVVVLSNFDRGYNKAIADACIRLTAAGIKYTIGE